MHKLTNVHSINSYNWNAYSIDFQKFIKINQTLSKMDALISGCDSPLHLWNYFFKFLFILSLLHQVFIAAHRLPLVAVSSGFSCCPAPPLEHSGFSSCSRRAQQMLNSDSRTPQASIVVAPGLAALGRWALPRPGIQLMSSALACVFLTSGPQGKSWKWIS